MKDYIVDLETDGLLPTVTRAHCMVVRDVVTGRATAFFDRGADIEANLHGGTIQDGIDFLANERWVGHNMIGFDLPVLEKLGYRNLPPRPLDQPQDLFDFDDLRVLDTLVASRLIWTELKQIDFANGGKWGLTAKLFGSHSLEAWGYRLGVLKGEFGKLEKWDTFTQAMLDYCVQDTAVTLALYERIRKKQWAPKSLALEHRFADYIDRQETNGIAFDQKAADDLCQRLMVRRAQLEAALLEHKTFAPFTNRRLTKVRKEERIDIVEFNPRSRQHVARALQERCGWEPEVFTETGLPEVSESVLKTLQFPGVEYLVEHFTTQKVLAMLAEGKQAWSKLVKADGRVHGRVNHNGAVSGRCTHSSPNMTQVPGVEHDKATKAVLLDYPGGYGWECRSLFITDWKDSVLVGCDAAGLELRTLAHYLAKYDNGEYVDLVLNGDVHTRNQQVFGLDTRDKAKTAIYALIYGAGPVKMGEIVGGGKKEGQDLIRRIFSGWPAFAALRHDLECALRRREQGHYVERFGKKRFYTKPGAWVQGLDGRQIAVRGSHSMLSSLNQGAGAVVMKVATVLLHRRATAEGLKWAPLLHVHDEYQHEVAKSDAERFAALAQDSITQAGILLNMRCPLAGTAKIGRNWAETH